MTIKPVARACDHCRKTIKIETDYLFIRAAVHRDVRGTPYVTPDSTRITNEQQVDLHKKCASAFFQAAAEQITDNGLPAAPTPKRLAK